uniref:Interleckin-17A/F1 n=1 Tax=Lateolabrax maculatus TaxID=315492 RepID=A0A894JZZ5_LATMC|nr:Interleckin-17A/F1 [Lateolabrax maculatus]
MVTSSEEVYATVTLTAIRINVRAEPDVQQNTSTEEEEEDLQLHKHQQRKQLSISHDDSLFPPTLSEARCLLHGCLDSEGQEDLSLESRPIMHQVLLLRRVRSAGAESGPGHSYHYRLESRLIAVGCTCVRPIIQHQQ